MKVNKWTTALASAGVIGGALAVQAEESPVMTALSSTTISGFVDTSMHWNLGTGNANVGQYGFNSPTKSDGFNLNQVNLQIGKDMDEGQWAAGYKAELMFGPDATGYNPSYNANFATDFAIKQAYVELRAPVGNGLDFKVGVFDTILGYEGANSVFNPNYTHGYAWGIEPTQHTGVLMSYQFNDMISASAGVANTATPGINARGNWTGPVGTIPTETTNGTKAESQKTWLGSVAVTAPESMGWFAGSTLYGGIVYGFAGNTTGLGTAASGAVGNQNQVNYYVGGTMTTPWEQLTLGASWDYAGASSNTTGGITSSSYYQNVMALYASYQVTEKLSLHGRGEYASGDLLYAQTNGANGQVWAGTLTAQYELWANVVTRAEVRWDQANSKQFGGRATWNGGNGSGDPSKSNDFMAAIQIAYLF